MPRYFARPSLFGRLVRKKHKVTPTVTHGKQAQVYLSRTALKDQRLPEGYLASVVNLTLVAVAKKANPGSLLWSALFHSDVVRRAAFGATRVATGGGRCPTQFKLLLQAISTLLAAALLYIVGFQVYCHCGHALATRQVASSHATTERPRRPATTSCMSSSYSPTT